MKKQNVIWTRCIPEPGDENMRVWHPASKQYALIGAVDEHFITLRLTDMTQLRLSIDELTSNDISHAMNWIYTDIPYLEEQYL